MEAMYFLNTSTLFSFLYISSIFDQVAYNVSYSIRLKELTVVQNKEYFLPNLDIDVLKIQNLFLL